MRVLVTGGSGFIGRAVRRRLMVEGHTPVVFDHGAPRSTDGWEGDVRDVVAVVRAVSDADAVIHLAGVLGTGELFDMPAMAVDVNILGALNVIEACGDSKQFVGIEMPRVWPNVYQATKTCARTLATAWHQNRGLRTSHVRAFNAFGPHQKVHGVQKIIPTFADRAHRGLPIPVWGDGKQTVDLIYVDDVARVLVEALAHSDDVTIDAGTRHAQRVIDVAREVHLIVGEDTGIEWLPMRPGETPARVVAGGEGWNRLKGPSPEFRHDDLVRTVEFYRPT